MINGLDLFLSMSTSFCLTCIATPILRTTAERLGIIDKPDENHKSHSKAVPYLGGLAIVFGVTSVTVIGTTLRFRGDIIFLHLALYVLLPAMVLSIVGLVDDIKKLSPSSRFFVQTLAGVFTASVLVNSDNAGTPLGIVWVDFLISVLWIIGITNSVNFLDNHDGGAAGVVAISSFLLFILAQMSDQTLIAALSLTLSAACLGFLVWNRYPASIYMGDAGALFLGTLLAGLLIRFDPESENRFASFAMPFLLVAVPILDTSIAVVSRIVRKKSPFEGGRDHLSHRLMRRGFSITTTPRILWALSLVFGILTIIIASSSYILQTYLTIGGIVFWILSFRYFWNIPHE